MSTLCQLATVAKTHTLKARSGILAAAAAAVNSTQHRLMNKMRGADTRRNDDETAAVTLSMMMVKCVWLYNAAKVLRLALMDKLQALSAELKMKTFTVPATAFPRLYGTIV